MAKHEFAKFGCTPCHGGDGAATTLAGAHQGGRGWDDPMLSNALAARNGLTMNEMIQMRCNFCHRHDVATPAMDEINLAKQLFKKKKCLLCHVVEGRGGATGPELTYEGDRNPELLNFHTRDRRAHDVQLECAASDQSECGFAEHRDARFQLQARRVASADADDVELASTDLSAGIHSRSRSSRGGDATVANVNAGRVSNLNARRTLSEREQRLPFSTARTALAYRAENRLCQDDEVRASRESANAGGPRQHFLARGRFSWRNWPTP